MKKLGKIKTLLSREEMKQIQGGSGTPGCPTTCNTVIDCMRGEGGCKECREHPQFPYQYCA